jgi:ferredoxin-NADP reductase
MRARFDETSYEIIVRLDDGGYTRLERDDGGNYRVGDRVRVQGPNIELLSQ